MKSRAARVRLSLAATLLAAALAFACSLEDGSVIGLGSDASTLIDASADGSTSADGDITDANGGSDVGTITDAGPDSSAPGRYIFATTSTTLYALSMSTFGLFPVGTFASCGIPAGYDTVDPSQDSLGRIFLLTHVNANGQFRYYGVQKDAGCADVHGGPGSGPTGSGFWAGYQKVGSTDTLLALESNQSPVLEYNGMAQYQGQVNNVIPNGGATSDIACTPSVCYTALPANRCPSDSGAADCLYAFESDGGPATQIGSFGKTGIVGIAYDQGVVYGFATDGSIIKISTTAPSVGMPLVTTGTSTTGLVWQGAASTSANL